MADALLDLLGITPSASQAQPVQSVQDPLLKLVQPSGDTSSVSTQAPPQPSKPARSLPSELARQVGLTARYGIEGVGNTLDFLATPFRAGMNAVLPSKTPTMSDLVTGQKPQDAISHAKFSWIADSLGLPNPETPTERVVGDATRMMAGSAVPMAGAAKLAPLSQGTTQAVMKTMAANPAQQIVSAGSSGLAGGAVREGGGSDMDQLGASLIAGVAAPMAMNQTQRIVSAGKNFIAPQQTMQIDEKINQALQNNNMTLADLPPTVQAGIRNDVQQALKIDSNLSPAAVRRLADYRLTGLTPTAGTLSLDPALVSQQKNLAKIGINSKDPAAQQLGQLQNQNNGALIQGLNSLGANTTDDAVAGGSKIIGALQSKADAAKASIGELYDAARSTEGRSATLDPRAFTNQANDLLDNALLGGKLPTDVRNLLNGVSTGKIPLTVDTAEQFKTRIGDLQRATADAGERKALGLVRQSLDNTPLLDGQGQGAIDAFNTARNANRTWMQTLEKTPALKAVLDEVPPDKFVQQFVIGGGNKANTMDLAMLKNAVKDNPEATTAIKTQITSYLKSKATNGAADEVANFSQSGYNKALNAIGDRKLGMFFSKEELNNLKALGRVASYEQVQPSGAAVNNSNTAGAGFAALLDRIGNSPLLAKIPMGKQVVADPLQNITLGMQSNRALNVPKSLLATSPIQPKPPAGLLLSPAAFMANDDDKRKGLLSTP